MTNMEVEEGRDTKGRFAPGNKLSPGRPHENNAAREFRKLLLEDGPRLYEKAWELINNLDSKPGDRVKMVIYLIDRLCGKIPQSLDVSTTEHAIPAEMTGFAITKTYLKHMEAKIAAADREASKVFDD